MTEIREKLVEILDRAAEKLRETNLPDTLAAEIERLAGQVNQRCVVAVVGQVKVGKSTFVNALLGKDLAKVGTTETTATINYFSHGKPPDSERPVRCHWRGGKTTFENRAFLDGLQGNDIETLRRADGIDHLEYFLEHPFLEQVTLVDTPGTNAVVEEHQNVTAEYMKLHDQLRERHNEDTERLGRDADAVIYLTGAVARATEKSFLEEFTRTTGGRSSALNAVGVMSKIELQPEVLAERHGLSRDIANQMKKELNTVVPVGAGVHRALDGLLEDDRAGLRRLLETLRRIPPEMLERLLKKDTRFLNKDYEDCPVSSGERRALFEELPDDVRRWAIFATIIRAASDPELNFDVDQVEVRLKEISNFEELKEILNKHFIERGHILRCFRIVDDARAVLNRIKFRRRGTRQVKDRLDRFIRLIRQAGGDPVTTRELEEFVYHHLDVQERERELEELHRELDREIGRLYRELEHYNADFEALQKLEKPEHGLSEEELVELRPLLGLYGSEVDKRLRGKVDIEYVYQRQIHWKERMEQAPFGSVDLIASERAYIRYGIIYQELNERPDPGVAPVTESVQ
jgi:septin family protein